MELWQFSYIGKYFNDTHSNIYVIIHICVIKFHIFYKVYVISDSITLEVICCLKKNYRTKIYAVKRESSSNANICQ